MSIRIPSPSVVALLSLLLAGSALAQASGPTLIALKPQYLPPAQLLQVLGVRPVDGRDRLEWSAPDGTHAVDVRRNDAANLLILTGSAADLEAVQALVREADVAPRQIEVEAQIVEVDEGRARDAGLDWTQIRTDLSTNFSHRRAPTVPKNFDVFQLNATAVLSNQLHLLEQAGAATLRNAPRILTLNNEAAQVLDGQRVTYITRYSTFTNLFETDSMDAGLTLNVLPSLGESGYLTLRLRAELTTLSSNISGSPVKDGQIVENTVVVKDGESVLLGGFTRVTDQKTHSGFPVLGRVLPFLFSREQVTHVRRESFVVVTPRVVDLSATLDPRTRERLEPAPGR